MCVYTFQRHCFNFLILWNSNAKRWTFNARQSETYINDPNTSPKFWQEPRSQACSWSNNHDRKTWNYRQSTGVESKLQANKTQPGNNNLPRADWISWEPPPAKARAIKTTRNWKIKSKQSRTYRTVLASVSSFFAAISAPWSLFMLAGGKQRV